MNIDMKLNLDNLTMGDNIVQGSTNSVSNPGYESLIQQFLYEHVQFTVPSAVQFEAISTAVFGTKQRRFGPMPSPEVQASVRQILRDSGNHVTFFLPWGSRKQVNGAPLDILEFMALKQLACLQEDLLRYGVTSEFHIRIEDMTDYWLFEDDPSSNQQVDTYADTLIGLGYAIFKPKTWKPHLETTLVSKDTFFGTASKVEELFYTYLSNAPNSAEAFAELVKLGWKSSMSQEQQDYYLRQYAIFYPNAIGVGKLAQYFASALSRGIHHATAVPETPHIFLTFAHPIPNNPVAPNRLFYRTLPQRFTNNHRSPWLASGYLQIGEDNSLCPKSLGFEESIQELIPHTAYINSEAVYAPYILV